MPSTSAAATASAAAPTRSNGREMAVSGSFDVAMMADDDADDEVDVADAAAAVIRDGGGLSLPEAAVLSGAPVEEDDDPDHPESNQGSNQGWPSSSSVHSGGGGGPHVHDEDQPEAMAEGSVAGSSPPLLPPHDLPHEAAGLQEDHQIEDDQELLLNQMIPMRGKIDPWLTCGFFSLLLF